MSARRRVLESRMPDPDLELDAPPPTLGRGPTTLEGAPRPASGREALNVGFATPKPPSVAPGSRWVGRGAIGTGGGDRILGRGSALALTPRMTALFVGLFGLATVTTIIALLIQGSPPKDVRTAASALASGPATDGSASASPNEAPEPVSKKRVRVKLPGPPRVADLAKQPGVRLVEDVMGPRSFIAALGEKGVPTDQVYRILKAFDGVRKFDKTGKKDRFVVALDRASNQVKGFEFVVSPLEIFQALDDNGTLTAQKLDLKVTEEEYVGSFYVGKNLQRSLEWGGFEPDLLRVIDEAFAGKISHDSFEEGGVVKVVATELTSLGDFIKYKNVVAIEYQPPDPAAAPVRAYTYQGASAKGYFDEKGRQPDGSGWGSPVPGAPVTSKFNPKRLHPVLKKVMPHNGTDYGAVTGTPVHAVFSGKLSFVGNAGPCGNMVAIMHANGIESGYCHLHKITPGLKVGAKIGSRAVIGQVGSTGRSTGPHLHFWTKKDAKFFDSETLKIDGFRVIPVDERAAFSQRKLELDARLAGIPMPDPPPAEPTRPSGPTASSSAAPGAGDPALEEDDSASPDKSDKLGGARSAGGEPSPPNKSGTAAKADAPVEVDPGDGEDLVGADLKR
jgi:murein DD-endopeptidase MepM/ murein hydrolase activator NlpD